MLSLKLAVIDKWQPLRPFRPYIDIINYKLNLDLVIDTTSLDGIRSHGSGSEP